MMERDVSESRVRAGAYEVCVVPCACAVGGSEFGLGECFEWLCLICGHNLV